MLLQYFRRCGIQPGRRAGCHRRAPATALGRRQRQIGLCTGRPQRPCLRPSGLSPPARLADYGQPGRAHAGMGLEDRPVDSVLAFATGVGREHRHCRRQRLDRVYRDARPCEALEPGYGSCPATGPRTAIEQYRSDSGRPCRGLRNRRRHTGIPRCSFGRTAAVPAGPTAGHPFRFTYTSRLVVPTGGMGSYPAAANSAGTPVYANAAGAGPFFHSRG